VLDAASPSPDDCYDQRAVRAAHECPGDAGRAPPSAEVVGQALADAKRSRDEHRRRRVSYDEVPPTPEDSKALALATEYLCAETRHDATREEIAFGRARLYYELHRWGDATVAYDEIARAPSTTDVPHFAVSLWLESLNLLYKTADGGPSCLHLMRMGTDAALARFCAQGPARIPEGGPRCGCGDPLCADSTDSGCDARAYDQALCDTLGRVRADMLEGGVR
jgi:hypothetical protein